MERPKINSNNIVTVFIYIIFTVGLIGHLTSKYRYDMLAITPFVLLLTGLAVIYFPLQNKNYRLLIWCLITYVLTFSFEVIGVKTGLIFGNYFYGTSLGIKVLGVPLVIGFNWVLVILGAIKISESLIQNKYLTPLLASTLAVGFDMFMEPVAIKLNYWQWQNGLIPFSNYVSWFVIAYFASLVLVKTKIKLHSSILAHYFIVQAVFFVLLFVFL